MELTNSKDIRELLGRHGFRFSKSMGQNFLTAAWVPERIADSALLDFLILGDAGACSLRQLGEVPDFDLSDRARGMREDYLSGAPDELHIVHFSPKDEEDKEDVDGN